MAAFADWARVSKTPAAIIFLDLSAAFDRVLRQLIVGVVHTTDTMEQLLRKAGVAEELANKFGAFFEQRCILHQMRADESLARIIHNAHVGVWFRMEATTGVAITSTGSRAGDAFGTTLFNLLMASALQMLEQLLCDLGMETRIGVPSKTDMLCMKADFEEYATYVDMSFVDDLAVCLYADDYVQLKDRVAKTAAGAAYMFALLACR